MAPAMVFAPIRPLSPGTPLSVRSQLPPPRAMTRAG